jgi:hypothetical protein
MGVGAVLGVAAPIDFTVPEALDLQLLQDWYLGTAATAASMLGGEGVGRAIVLGLMAVVGLGGLGALLAASLEQPARTVAGLVLQIQSFAITCGWLMYAITRGFVFDRYLLVWCVALPIAWVLLLPRVLVAIQIVPLLAAFVWFTYTWLY